MAAADFSPSVISKLEILQRKLGTSDADAALDKILNIANFVVETVNSPDSKLLVERGGKYTELKEIA